MADAFLSYSHVDRDAVADLAHRLESRGVTVWFDDHDTVAGTSFIQRIDDGLRRAGSFVVCIGPHGMGDVARRELDIAIARSTDDGEFRVIPVLLPGVSADLVSSQLPSLFLATLSWVDLRDGVDDPDGLDELRRAVLNGEAPARPVESTGTCPYRGLESFGPDDSAWFFGRSREVELCIRKLLPRRFLAVIGASGSGKSSLAKAGLLPALGRHRVDGCESWEHLIVRPGRDPMAAMAGELAGVSPGASPVDLDGELRQSERALSLELRARLRDGKTGWALVIDQFEELFTLCVDSAQRTFFLDALLATVDAQLPRLVVVITLRADFYASCATHRDLAAVISDHQVLLGPMDAEGLREAIERPATRAGLRFQPKLPDAILADVVAQRGALPLLEHALQETWERRVGDRLTLGGYLESGGVKGAIAKRAEVVLEDLRGELPEAEAVARHVLVRLTRVGDGTEDSAQPQPRAALEDAWRDPAAASLVIDRFTQARLLTTGARSGAAVVEVSHEALIRNWPRLQGWVAEDREGLRLRQEITDAASEYASHGDDEAYLFRGSRLELAETWRAAHPEDLSGVEAEFLRRSLAAERRAAEAERASVAQQARARVVRRAAVGLMVAVVAVTVAAAIAALQWRSADRERERARSFQLAALAREELGDQPDLAALLAVAGVRRESNEVTLGTLSTALTRSPAAMAFSGPGGRLLASGMLAPGRASSALVIDDTEHRRVPSLLEGERLTPLPGVAAGATAAAVTNDGLQAAVAVGPEVHLVDLARGESRPVGPAGELVLAVAIDPSIVASGSSDGQVRRWSPEGTEETVVDGQARSVAVLEGGTIAVGTDRGEVLVWPRGAARAELLAGPFESPVSVLVPDPATGRVLAGVGSSVVPIDVTTATVRPAWPVAADVTGIAVAGDGRQAAVSTSEGTLELLDGSSGRRMAGPLRARPPADATPGAWLSLALDGDTVTALRDDGRVVTFTLAAQPRIGQPVRVDDATGVVESVAFDTRGQLVGAGPDGLHRWPLDGNPPSEEITHAELALASVARSAAATVNADGTVALWRVDADPIVVDRPPGPTATAVAVSDDANRVAIGADDGSVWVGEPGAGPAQPWPAHQGPVSALALAPDASEIISGGDERDRRVLRWQLDGSDRVPEELAVTGGSVDAIAYNTDGSLLAVGGDDRLIRIFEDGRADPVVTLRGHRDRVRGVAFSPGAELIASVSEDGTMIVWSLSTGQPLGDPVPLPGGTPASVAFDAADGTRLATASGAEVTLWDWDPVAWEHAACTLAARGLLAEEWRSVGGTGEAPELCQKG